MRRAMIEEGAESGHNCPKCDVMMLFQMAVMDSWNYGTDQHTTTEYPIIECPECEYYEVVEE